MSGEARVWNDNKYTYQERFKGQNISIEPGAFIIMPLQDAYEFKGTFCQPVILKNGRHDERFYKMIRVEKIDPKSDKIKEVEKKEAQTKTDLTCNACGFVAKNSTGLSAHIRHNHLQQMESDDARKAIIKEVDD